MLSISQGALSYQSVTSQQMVAVAFCLPFVSITVNCNKGQS